MTAFDAGAVVVATAACVTDLRSARIPNALTVFAAVVGLVAHATWPQGLGAATSLGGAAAGLLVFLPFFALGGMGGGDVKLMTALGAWLGWPRILPAALTIAVVGGVVAVLVALSRGYLRQALRNIRGLLQLWWTTGMRPEPTLTLTHDRAPRLPYAVPVLLGLLVTLWRQ
jgi:prepilin peptidase CpaA